MCGTVPPTEIAAPYTTTRICRLHARTYCEAGEPDAHLSPLSLSPIWPDPFDLKFEQFLESLTASL